MQQQQLAAQLAHHGGSGRPPPLSPTPHTSDDDSDISLGAHSPPISSPGPLRFGTSSPTPITSFRFGPHSPGPMPPQFRFNNHTTTNNNITGGRLPLSLDGSSRQSSPGGGDYRKLNIESPINVDSIQTSANFEGRNRSGDASPINVDSSSDYQGQNRSDNSPIRVDGSPVRQNSPPMNLRLTDTMRLLNQQSDQLMQRLQPEQPLPLRLTSLPSQQLSSPLRIHVSGGRLQSSPIQQIGSLPHSGGGIVRIASQSPVTGTNPPPALHRPFSPSLT